MRKKVCIVITSLANGGTERFGATLSVMLNDLGYDVHILSTKNRIEYPYKGKLFNLEKEAQNKSVLKKISLLNTYFKNHDFDVIIDNRARRQFLKELYIFRWLYKRSRVISMVHNYNIFNYFPGGRFKSNLVYNANNGFVSVSKGIKERIESVYGYKNVKHIYNPISIMEISEKASENHDKLNYQYILYFGRFEEHSKNLTLLINAYKSSKLRSHKIKLVLLGKGEDEAYLRKLVREIELEKDIVFLGYNANPFPYVKNALFSVLSSNYEGFPMSIIESLAIGTPVVSVDCPSGPSEIINTGKNGILVEFNNEIKLSQAFDRFLENKKFYEKSKKNAKQSVTHLDVDKVKEQWHNLIENE